MIITVFVLMALNLDLLTQMPLALLGFGIVLAAYAPHSRFGSRAPSRAREVVE